MKVVSRKTATRMQIINWSRFQNVTFRMEGSVLLTGANGSGKSTILDAVTYLLTGNTQFNKAAKDRDRTVLSYVRGDTNSNGAQRFLRQGSVISYLAMEFRSPTEKEVFVCGVCIESATEADYRPNWFVLHDTSLEDVNFARVEEGRLIVTPRNELTAGGRPVNARAFMARDTGVRQVMRAMGLRYDPRKYRSKLIRMLAFNPENNIDRFIQDCVLDPGKVDSLKEVREQREKFEELKRLYDNLRGCRDKLEICEQRARDYEGRRRRLRIDEMMLDHQELCALKQETEESQRREAFLEQRLVRLGDQILSAESDLKDAEQRLIVARTNDVYSGMKNTISELERQKDRMEGEQQRYREQIRELTALRKKLESFLQMKAEGPEENSMRLSPQDSQAITEMDQAGNMTEEQKEGSFRRIAEEGSRLTRYLGRQVWSLENQCEEYRQRREELSKQIHSLEANIQVFPKEAESVRQTLASELEKRGIHTDVRFVAELVQEVKDPGWRKAIETFLGRRRFNIIIDGKYCGDALEIVREKSLNGTGVIITDQLPDREEEPGSAAEQLTVPNIFARRYLNYLLNGIHLCDTLDELHEHPAGALMKDGMLAKSYAASRMNMRKTVVYFGKDAIRLQLRSAREEMKQLEQEMETAEKALSQNRSRADALRRIDFSADRYHMDAPERSRDTAARIDRTENEIREIQDNPDFLAVIQEVENAEEARKRAEQERNRIQKDQMTCQLKAEEERAKQQELSEQICAAQEACRQSQSQYPELVDVMKKEYEERRRRLGRPRVLQQQTVQKLRGELSEKYENALISAQLDYCRLAGADMNRFGPSYISFYRDEYRDVANVRIEEAQSRLDSQGDRLESAFMTDFVAELNEKIRAARGELSAINRELRELPFGQDTYRFVVREKADRAPFFRICRGLEKYMDNAEAYMNSDRSDEAMETDIREFMNMILDEEDESEYTDYRKYFTYDMEITSRQGGEEVQAELSRKQGSASGGEKQTPYFIILAASLMQCYPRNVCCARLAFIDEAFSAMSPERIEQMVRYFNDNGFQVIYSAPPEKIGSIGEHVGSIVSLVMTGRYTNVVEGLIEV